MRGCTSCWFSLLRWLRSRYGTSHLPILCQISDFGKQEHLVRNTFHKNKDPSHFTYWTSDTALMSQNCKCNAKCVCVWGGSNICYYFKTVLVKTLDFSLELFQQLMKFPGRDGCYVAITVVNNLSIKFHRNHTLVSWVFDVPQNNVTRLCSAAWWNGKGNCKVPHMH